MNLQAQQKSSSKRTGKRTAYFNEQEIAVSKEPQQQLKEGQYYGHGGNIQASQTVEISHAGGLTSVPNNVALMNSVYSQDRGESMMMSQAVTAVKWQNSLMGNRLPERGDSHWQSPPSMWNHSMVFGGNPKGPHSNAGAPGFYGHPDALKRNQEKGVFVQQLDLYGDAVQQMMSQKAQLEQQALVRQQAQMNSFHQMQKQQQQQNQSLPLQPFQLAFGHQGQKQGLPELLHVFQEAPASSSPAFTAQQKQQALPQLQLFENFYPQQQQQQQQQAATQAFGLQQTTSMAQPHVAAAAPQHHMMAHQFQQTERNQELFKALTEQNQQTVLPQTQIPFPRRSRRLSKEGAVLTSAGEALASKQAEEQPSNLFLHPWQTHQQEVPLQQLPESLAHNKSSFLQPKRLDLGQKDVLLNSELCQMETERQATAQNGGDGEKQAAAAEENTERTNDFQGVRGGVIQSTRRRRRVSQEANLLTLAQKAVELASLQNVKELDTSEEKKSVLISAPGPTAAKNVVEFAGSSPAPKRAREDNSLVPLIIPVSVPVRKIDLQSLGKEKSEDGKLQRGQTNDRTPCDRKPSVIVTRRRSNRNTNMETSNQHEDAVPKDETEGFIRKPKQRPRPEPLFIPPKAGTFIAPPVYSNITPYQSHLRSPVRLADHPSDKNFELPPYTPPPILSPVREGSGLYFNAILSSGGHSVPPPMTPKSAHRTLLRSNSSEVTPPVLTVVGEATPVSIEPRINVGTRFQAEIPSLQDRSLAAADEHKAELVWQPWGDLETNKVTQENVENLLAAACSSIFPGAGTNQELALHFLHEAKGNILGALTKLLLKRPVRSPTHPLADYHYTGSDKWKVAEKKLFNKGIAIYKKDFFLVQKLIKTKTVAQCVEFYYTYKKQVKIGRNGTLIFGDIDVANEKSMRDEAEVDIKSSHRFARVLPPRRDIYSEEQGHVEEEEEEDEEEEEAEEGLDNRKSTFPLKDEETLQDDDDDANMRSQEAGVTSRIGRKPREATVKPRKPITAPVQRRRRKQKIKSDATNKTQNTENTFPCKKCGRVFYKVKSRSAHMKSHAEQEKKAAALKQQEREAAAAAAAAAAAHSQARQEESSESGSSSSGSSSASSDEDGEI
ncbi:PREDICTED: ELM2 and SANT domain-containing protein 1 isoform X2 [Calidris pugnax]|uniref:ELM2 and SANT domain-containing protein 1 isoform X1 n=1 Tax=Calidris pugnax TaxID=198806 RepID=UPI00071CD36D|nr:PREDICTED: ELM2 and SANT domain-containing protein 1 isoform X1 [Calidris pugnax]XP_014805835.1 PREDICTED: ELM2 and SANT domain-containing protein 1 isoform X2 [Calidris pugnax]